MMEKAARRQARVILSLEFSLAQVRDIVNRDHRVLTNDIRGPVDEFQEYLNLLVKAEARLERAKKQQEGLPMEVYE